MSQNKVPCPIFFCIEEFEVFEQLRYHVLVKHQKALNKKGWDDIKQEAVEMMNLQ